MIDVHSKHEYEYEKTRANKLSKIASDYRKDYLALRKMVRNYILSNQDQDFPKELIKAAGIKQ